MSGGKKSMVSVEVWRYARYATEPPTFSSTMSSPCKPFLSLPIFPFIIEQWEKKHLSENIHFGKVYIRQVHPSILCYLFLRHFFSTLFWLSCLSLPSASVLDFWLPCSNLGVRSSMYACICVWWGVGECKVEEWLQDDKLLLLRKYITLNRKVIPQLPAPSPIESCLTKARKFSSWKHSVSHSDNPKLSHHLP